MRRLPIALLCALVLVLAVDLAARQTGQAGGASAPAAPRPVYVMLFATIDDPLHAEFSEERILHILDLMRRTGEKAPAAGISCLFQFSGTLTDALARRNNANHVLDRLRDAATRGAIEVGYDGTEEPTFVARPRPNFRAARTPEDRWRARTEATGWFLDEFKDPVTGEPDPARSGGLRRVVEVFGDVRSIAGASLELGGDPELVNLVRRRQFDGIMPGLPEGSAYPGRTVHGYGGASSMHGRLVAPGSDTAPELFWQDGVLRVSDTSGDPVKVINASEGVDAAGKLLAGLDRTRPHVLRVRLGSPGIYIKRDFAGGRYSSPLQYVYDNPKGARLPAEGWPPRDQVEAALGRERALVEWLATEFFRENPGSRFVSVGTLKRWTVSGTGGDVSKEELAAAAGDLLAQWKEIGNYPPSFARSAARDFSLADMFHLLSSALAVRQRTGALPSSLVLGHLFGPLEMGDDEGPRQRSVAVGAVVDTAAGLADRMKAGVWQALPPNIVPSTVEVAGHRVNAAQFLRLMGEAYVAAGNDAVLEIAPSYMFHGIAEGFPRTRLRSEVGAAWTVKPARLVPRD